MHIQKRTGNLGACMRYISAISNYIHYIDTGVLLKNTHRKIHTELHPGPEKRIFHIVTSEDIDDILPAFSRLFVLRLFVYIIKKTLHVSWKI